jgi:hypothetical protein
LLKVNRISDHVFLIDDFAIPVHNAAIHLFRVEIDTAVKVVLSGIEFHKGSFG